MLPLPAAASDFTSTVITMLLQLIPPAPDTTARRRKEFKMFFELCVWRT